jgi:hypothetical protein
MLLCPDTDDDTNTTTNTNTNTNVKTVYRNMKWSNACPQLFRR